MNIHEIAKDVPAGGFHATCGEGGTRVTDALDRLEEFPIEEYRTLDKATLHRVYETAEDANWHRVAGLAYTAYHEICANELKQTQIDLDGLQDLDGKAYTFAEALAPDVCEVIRKAIGEWADEFTTLRGEQKAEYVRTLERRTAQKLAEGLSAFAAFGQTT